MFFIIFCSKSFYFFRTNVNYNINQDTKDERAGYRGKSYLTKGKSHTANARDKDNGYNEQILVIAKINLLYHLKTGYSDKSVKRYANTAHYTRRNGSKEGYEGGNE